MYQTRRFRTYNVRSNTEINCRIWEAIRLTMATPAIFKATAIVCDSGTQEVFVGGDIKINNPSKEVAKEALLLFGTDWPFGTITSIGAGHYSVTGLSEPDDYEKDLHINLFSALQDLASDCERVAEEVVELWKHYPNRHFRFNAPRGAGKLSLEEWRKTGDIVSHTKAYLLESEVSEAVDVLVNRLCAKKVDEPLTLGEICVLPSFIYVT